jgi:hypothetical protein
VIKQRILGLALGLALMGSLVGFAGTATAADSHLDVYADIASVASITLTADDINFGDNLTFIGGGTGSADSCANGNGWTFVASTVGITVQSSEDYSLERQTGGTSDLLNKMSVQTGTYVDCATHLTSRGAVSGTMDTDTWTAGTSYSDTYSLDVIPGDNDSSGTLAAYVEYVLVV